VAFIPGLRDLIAEYPNHGVAALLMAATLFVDGFSMARRKKTAWAADLSTARDALAEKREKPSPPYVAVSAAA
jgi:hypothetical protein